jgi:guanylate kinase
MHVTRARRQRRWAPASGTYTANRMKRTMIETPGNLFVVAAPSGAGKSSLVNALLELDSHLALSVSHTTRAPRGQEQDGREYWFIDEARFRAMVEGGEFFEWAEVHGHLYGTSRKAIESRLGAGEDVVL